MDNIKNFNELPEGDAKDSINIFLDDLLKKLSDSFSNQPIEILAHDEYYEVRFVTKEQKMLENLIDALVKKMGLHVFYVIRQNEGKNYRCVLYSKPVRKMMYIVYATSNNYGLTDEIVVSFYDSIETMYLSLRHEYSRLGKINGDVLEKQDIRDLIRNFY